MPHDEARPQSNERDPTKPAPGLESAPSSPAPVLPTDAAAPQSVPRSGELSPAPAPESGSPAPVESTASPIEPARVTGAATPSDSPVEKPGEVAPAPDASTPTRGESTAPAPAVSDTGSTTVPPSDVTSAPSSATDSGTTPAADQTSTPTGDDFHTGDHPHDEYHHDPHHDPHHDYHHDYHHDDYHAGEGGTGHGSEMTTGSGGTPPPDAPDPLFTPDEEGGGPIKSFLEHLEDFRWVIIRCATAIMVAMIVCLLAANWIVAILKWPLDRAAALYPDKRQHVSVVFGPKEVISVKVDTNNLPAWPLGTNRFVELELAPVRIGTNAVLTLRVKSVSDIVPPGKAKPLVYINPMGPFLNSLHIAFFGGLLLAAPFVTFFIADFVIPALKAKEKKYFLKAMGPAAALFIVGVVLCYFVLLPLALRAAEQYSHWMGVDMPFWKAEEYFGFCIKFMIGMGLGFEMPVVLLALVKIGLLDHHKLASWRRYMILVNLILGALLTTPEVITQVAMFIPLQCLYEITIWIAWYWEQEDPSKARKRAVVVVGLIIIAIELVWLGIQFGWPWLREAMK